MINFSELLWSQRPMEQRRSDSKRRSSASLKELSPELSRARTITIEVPPETRIALLSNAEGPGADRFRYLRMQLRELKAATNLRTVLITSPLPQDGKSTVALNVAMAMAEKGTRRVLLIEADLHRPTVAQNLKLAAERGLAECLEDGLDPLSLICRIEPLGWYLLQSGKARSNPSELLQSDSLERTINAVAPHFDWVIIDSPPVTPLVDAIALSRHVDASLLVVRAGRTPKELVRNALNALGQKHVLGVILNGSAKVNKTYSEYYGAYGK